MLALLGADVEARDNSGRTPTDVAINQNIKNYLRVIFPASMKLLTAAAENNIIDLKNAIEHEADVNAFDRHGNTPLHFAAEHGNWQAVYFLLVHRADPSIENIEHETPIHTAWKHHQYNILGLFHMAAAQNATKGQAFSQFMREYINSITQPK